MSLFRPFGRSSRSSSHANRPLSNRLATRPPRPLCPVLWLPRPTRRAPDWESVSTRLSLSEVLLLTAPSNISRRKRPNRLPSREGRRRYVQHSIMGARVNLHQLEVLDGVPGGWLRLCGSAIDLEGGQRFGFTCCWGSWLWPVDLARPSARTKRLGNTSNLARGCPAYRLLLIVRMLLFQPLLCFL